MNEVGKLYFASGKVIMQATDNESILQAQFDMANIPNLASVPTFGKWSSKIAFDIQKQNHANLLGDFIISASVNLMSELSCSCHSLIMYAADKENIVLEISRNSRMFRLNISSENHKEIIEVMPWDNLNGFIKHVISKGKYDPKRYRCEYDKYTGIFTTGEETSDRLHVFLSERKWNKEISCKSEFPLKVGDEKSEELVIQKGMLMHKLDPDMFDRIKDIKELLTIGDISLLDNLVSVCYDKYTNEELSALLGIERKPMVYQDGADSLIDSYFGIGNESSFFTAEQQKKFIKSKKEV